MIATRQAADTLLSALDIHIRAAGPAKPEPPAKDSPAKPGKPAEQNGGLQDTPDAGVPLPAAGEDAVDIPDDPEALLELIVGMVKEDLEWDGQTGDPNEGLAALEDSLADMFDADVEITWNGEDMLTMRVEGEEPMPLTVDSLGELLEELAKSQGGDTEDGEEPGTEDDDSEDDDAGGERGYASQRGLMGNFTEDLHPRIKGGVGGGRFTKKGGGGAVKQAAKPAGKAAPKVGGKPGGAKPGNAKPGGRPAPLLARRAMGRAGPRATSKAVGKTLGAGTGKRVRVSGNKDGTFNVGAKKKKKTGKQVAAIIFTTIFAFAAAGAAVAAIATVVGVPAGVVMAGASLAGIAEVAVLVKRLRS